MNINIKYNNLITILSSSQTGNSDIISSILYNKLIKLNINSRFFFIQNYNVKEIIYEKYLIIITSTYGNGEPPENAVFFYDYIKLNKKKIDLSNMKYSILSLGDSSYKYFCKFGKDLDDILLSFGAIKIFDRIDCDINYEKKSNEWINNIINFFNKQCYFVKNVCLNNKDEEKYFSKSSFMYNKKFIGSILNNVKITGRYSSKDVRHIVINIKNLKLNYLPGDYIGIFYKNDTKLVNLFLRSLNLDSKKKIINIFNNNKLNSFFHIFKKYIDITKNTLGFIKNYSNLSKNSELLKLINNNKVDNLIKLPIIEIINIFPCDKNSIINDEKIFCLFNKLNPRYYSISSSKKEYLDELHITVNVVKYKYDNKIYYGGASNYLCNLSINSEIIFFVKKNNNFKLPKNNNVDIIMISTGTGIAPFLSFMQERKNIVSSGKNWLIYGNKNFYNDFLYQNEIKQYKDIKLLNKIDLAWSEDKFNKKMYVQDIMYIKKKCIWKWINNNSYIYFCGNKKYSEYIDKTFIKIFVKCGKMTKNESLIFLKKLRKNLRYQKDIY